MTKNKMIRLHDKRRQNICQTGIIGMAYLCIHVLVYVRSGLECSKGDNAIQWIKLYPLDSAVCFANTYPLDSDLFFG